MKIAILLISEQTLPNVLFLKQFNEFDKYIFLTTSKMEERGMSRFIQDALKLEDEFVDRVEIDPENANTSLHILNSKHSIFTGDITVHLTGGTKMMALAAYAFFTSIDGTRILYLPFNAPHFLEVYPEPKEIALTVVVSLREYLFSHGAVIQSKLSNWNEPQLIQESNTLFKKALNGETAIFENAHSDSDKFRKSFLSGGWFEIWLAHKVQSLLSISNNDIIVNAKINRKGIKQNASFEYDVIFVYDNRLYAAECKFFISYKFANSKVQKEIFKFASLNQQLGLFTKPFIVIANSVKQEQSEQIQELCKLLRISSPQYLDDIKDESQLIQFIKSIK